MAAPRLLIVDDQPEIRAALAEYLAGTGYAVETAADAPSAIEMLSERYDAVVADIRLPGGSGLDLVPAARRANPRVGVFLITGYPALDTLMAAKQHGAVAYLRKPVNLAELGARLSAFLGEGDPPAADGVLLVVGTPLGERLGDRLAGFRVVVLEEESEAAFLAALRRHRPRAVLADAGARATAGLLAACQGLGQDASCFVLVTDEASLDAANDMLFRLGAAGCVPAQANPAQVAPALKAIVEEWEARRQEGGAPREELPSVCEFAHPYRNGYYCMASGPCPFGPFQGGWISLDGKEHQKCLKRPLLLDTPDEVGYLSLAGRPDAEKCMDVRRRLQALIRRGRKKLIVDAEGLTHVHYNLFEALADVAADAGRAFPDGELIVINLSEALLDGFRRAIPNRGIRFYGARMVDRRATFARWGTRFD